LKLSDLRPAARLAVEATAGVIDLVEAMHARITQVALPGSAVRTQTRGLTGLVYKSVRGVTQGVGVSLDTALAALAPLLSSLNKDAQRNPLPTPEREAVLAALNGVLGDHLAATANPLATPMTLRQGQQTLALNPAALASALPQATGKVLVLVHGLCMNHLQWTREGHDHGAALARDAGWTPLYLHYNSGLPIASNGALLCTLLGALQAAWPVPLQRLAIVGHSMGGLVARSAIHQAEPVPQPWLSSLTDLVCLGSPHHGAPLERAGQWLDKLLGISSYSVAFVRLTRLRSAGITDLRDGRIVSAAEDATASFVQLPPGLRCYAIAGSLRKKPAGAHARPLGDGLVPVDSALGRHADPARTLAFAPSRQIVVAGTGHLGLLSSAEVYAALRSALG